MATDLNQDVQALIPQSIKNLQDYMAGDGEGKANQTKARVALSIIRTAVTIQNTAQNRDRFYAGVAKTLSDGDVQAFSEYIKAAVPNFPVMERQLPPGK